MVLINQIDHLLCVVFGDVGGREDVVNEAAHHHHLAGVQLHSGVPQPRALDYEYN